MKRFILVLSIASLALAGCTRESVPAGRTVTIPVDCGEQSKVYLDSTLRTHWNALDKVSVFYGGSQDNLCGVFMGNDGDTKGAIAFETTSDIPMGISFAVMPYSPANSLSGSVLTAAIPASQPYAEGSFASGSAVLAAKEGKGGLSFYYANAVIALTLESGSSLDIGIRRIDLRSQAGENIAGTVEVDMSGDGAPKVSVGDGGFDSIVMAASSEGKNICTIPAGERRTFYFCVAPVCLLKGYCFDVTLDNGEVRKVRSTRETVLRPGVLEKIENGLAITKKIIIDIDELTWTPALPTSKKATDASGVTHSFVNPEDGRTYSIVACSTEGGYYRSSTFIRFNSPGNWMKLPMISKMRLCEFGAMVQQNDAKTFCVSSTPEAKGDVVPATAYPTGEMIYSSVAGDVHEAYINIMSNNTQIVRIELFFE